MELRVKRVAQEMGLDYVIYESGQYSRPLAILSDYEFRDFLRQARREQVGSIDRAPHVAGTDSVAPGAADLKTDRSPAAVAESEE